MPPIYASPLSKLPREGGKTTYLVPTGKHSMFEGNKGIRLIDVTDGTSNTIKTAQIDDGACARAGRLTAPFDVEVAVETDYAHRMSGS